jgi:hypothetical protein
VQARELPTLRNRVKFYSLGLCPQQLTEGWTKFIPGGIWALEFTEGNFATEQEFERLRRGLGQLQKSAYFATHLRSLSICWFRQEEAVMEQLLQSLLLSPMRRARALQKLTLSGVKLRPDFVRRLQTAYPSAKIIGQ